MTNPRYYEDGKQISEVEATDARGVVRDGVSVRVRQQFLDGAGFLRDAAGPLRITDGSGSADGLHRPGWRVASGGSLDDMILRDIQRERIQEAHAEYLDGLTNAWQSKSPPGSRQRG